MKKYLLIGSTLFNSVMPLNNNIIIEDYGSSPFNTCVLVDNFSNFSNDPGVSNILIYDFLTGSFISYDNYSFGLTEYHNIEQDIDTYGVYANRFEWDLTLNNEFIPDLNNYTYYAELEFYFPLLGLYGLDAGDYEELDLQITYFDVYGDIVDDTYINLVPNFNTSFSNYSMTYTSIFNYTLDENLDIVPTDYRYIGFSFGDNHTPSYNYSWYAYLDINLVYWSIDYLSIGPDNAPIWNEIDLLQVMWEESIKNTSIYNDIYTDFIFTEQRLSETQIELSETQNVVIYQNNVINNLTSDIEMLQNRLDIQNQYIEQLVFENEQLNSKHVLSNVFELVRGAFDGIIGFLEIEIMPNLNIGTIIFIPVVIGVIFFILKALVL